MKEEQEKIFKRWDKIPVSLPCSVMIITGKKMSNPNNDIYTVDSEGNKHPIGKQGDLPYVITENNVYSISELANLFEVALNKIDDGSTISIVIGIDN